MSASVLPFEPGAALARISSTSIGFKIDTRGPRVLRQYDFVTAGGAAEFAIALRDSGGWPLRFSAGVEAVRELVIEISAEDEE